MANENPGRPQRNVQGPSGLPRLAFREIMAGPPKGLAKPPGATTNLEMPHLDKLRHRLEYRFRHGTR